MSDDEITTLIQELKRIQLHEQRVLAALDEAYQRSTSVQGDTTPLPSPSSTNTPAAIYPFIPKYSPGDHVIITNKVRRPLNRAVEINDRKAVVLEVVSISRINIRTYNGTVTWRAPKNIKHQEDE
jgi:hypothetical protein